MNQGRGGRDPFSNFGDPFGGFGSFGGFRGPRDLMSSFFGGRDPFDDPFFKDPFGSMFGPSLFPHRGAPFPHMNATSFIEDRPPEPKRSRGPIIEEINSDEEKEEQDEQKTSNPRKLRRASKEPYVEEVEDGAEPERKNQQLQYRSNYNGPFEAIDCPQTRCFTYQSSTVAYGGSNGAYYTSSKTRRTGSDGVTFEESKEADTTSREASHKVSCGIHDKGHSVLRKLNSDGTVDTMQTLHNLEQDELPSFEDRWTSRAGKQLPGSLGSSSSYTRTGFTEQQPSRGGWALPSNELRHPVHATARGRHPGARYANANAMPPERGSASLTGKGSRSQG